MIIYVIVKCKKYIVASSLSQLIEYFSYKKLKKIYLRSFNLLRPVFLGVILPTLRPGGVVLPTDD